MNLPEKEWFIKVPWGRLCIVAWGDCYNPPVLLCHGLVDTAVSFRPLVQKMPSNFYYIAMELPGSGKSDRFPPGLMLTGYDLAYSVEAVAKHFRWETFTCIGHSLGTLILRLYNIGNPGRISKLIELDPINFWGIEPEQFRAWYEKFYVNFYKNYGKYNMTKEKAPKIKWKETVQKISKQRDISEEMAAAILERMSESAGDGLIRYTYDLRMRLVSIPPFSPDHIRKIFTNLKTPTLIIASKDSMKKGLFRNTKFLLDEKCYPNNNVRMRPIAGGHNMHISNPGDVAALSGQFLLHSIEGLDAKAKL